MTGEAPPPVVVVHPGGRRAGGRRAGAGPLMSEPALLDALNHLRATRPRVRRVRRQPRADGGRGARAAPSLRPRPGLGRPVQEPTDRRPGGTAWHRPCHVARAPRRHASGRRLDRTVWCPTSSRRAWAFWAARYQALPGAPQARRRVRLRAVEATSRPAPARPGRTRPRARTWAAGSRRCPGHLPSRARATGGWEAEAAPRCRAGLADRGGGPGAGRTEAAGRVLPRGDRPGRHHAWSCRTCRPALARHVAASWQVVGGIVAAFARPAMESESAGRRSARSVDGRVLSWRPSGSGTATSTSSS